MNKFTNDKGMALVLTLAIIVIIMLVCLTLFFQITNATKQVAKTEQNIEARHLAEMGRNYFNQYILTETDDLALTSVTEVVHQLDIIKKTFPKTVTIEHPNKDFQITFSEIITSEEEIIIPFTSQGTVDDNEVIIDSEIIVSINTD